jgi:hypothetical protein
MVEVDGQFKFVAAPLDLDAAGNGLLQLDSPFARPIAHGAPIIIHQPMAKFILMEDGEYPSRPGDFSDFSLEFVQDLAP